MKTFAFLQSDVLPKQAFPFAFCTTKAPLGKLTLHLNKLVAVASMSTTSMFTFVNMLLALNKYESLTGVLLFTVCTKLHSFSLISANQLTSDISLRKQWILPPTFRTVFTVVFNSHVKKVRVVKYVLVSFLEIFGCVEPRFF